MKDNPTPPPSPPIPPPTEWDVVRPKIKPLTSKRGGENQSPTAKKAFSPSAKPTAFAKQLKEQRSKLKGNSKKKLIPESFEFDGYDLTEEDEEGERGENDKIGVGKENVGCGQQKLGCSIERVGGRKRVEERGIT